MTTARDIIYDAFRGAGILGIGQDLSAEDATQGFNLLNDFLAQLRRKRYTLYHLVETSFQSNGALYYTVGPSGNFNIDPRPDRIESAWFIQLNQPPATLPVSYPLEQLPSYEDYAQIALKTLNSWPQWYFFDSDYPTGKLYVNPIPASGQYETHILTKVNLAQFTNLSGTVNLPLEYLPAMKWNLIERLLAYYPRAQENPIQAQRIQQLAKDSLNVLRQANAQIPRLSLPQFFQRHGQYNIYSDNNC